MKIETERFFLRELIESDSLGMFQLDSDPEVHKYLGNKPIESMEQASRIIEHVQSQYVKYGIGRWAIIDKVTNEFIGWSGLKFEKCTRTNLYYFDLGYRLRKKFWRKGIAIETAIEVLKYGFEEMNLKEICAAAHVDNFASNKILIKLGFNFIERFNYDGSAHNWYELNKKN